MGQRSVWNPGFLQRAAGQNRPVSERGRRFGGRVLRTIWPLFLAGAETAVGRGVGAEAVAAEEAVEGERSRRVPSTEAAQRGGRLLDVGIAGKTAEPMFWVAFWRVSLRVRFRQVARLPGDEESFRGKWRPDRQRRNRTGQGGAGAFGDRRWNPDQLGIVPCRNSRRGRCRCRRGAHCLVPGRSGGCGVPLFPE